MNEIEKASKSVGDDNEQFTEHLLERLHATRSATKRVAEQTAIKPAGAAPKQPPRQPPAPQAKPQPEARVQLPTLAQQRQATTTTDGALEEMNNAYAIIDNVGGRNGKAVIASWEPSSLDPTKQVLAFQSKESFLLRHSNRYVSRQVIDENGEPKTVKQPLGQWWLGHQHRRQYRSVTFMPAGPPIVNGCLNLWRGWGVEPTPGDWSLIREHIETVIANGDAEAADYVIRWIAWSIQNPNRQAEVALVLIGEKGAGKGTLVRPLQRIFGDHAFQITSREEVIGKFNGHLQDCILFIADEAYWGGDKRCVGRLQGMITEPTLPIERKGIDLIQVRNLLHVVMLAEPGWVIPAGRFERRYAALEVSSARRRDRTHFKALHQQIDEGGAEAMFYDLREMDLGDWHPRDLPDSLLTGAALQKQQSHTLPPLEQWYLGLLHNGALPGALPNRPNTAPTRRLVDDARDKFPRLRYDLSDAALRNFLVDSLERIGISCAKYKNSAFNGWSFPTLAECREAWEAKYGEEQWDNPIDEWGEAEATQGAGVQPAGAATRQSLKTMLGTQIQSAINPKPSPPQPSSAVANNRPLPTHNYPSWRRV